ncbi:hypothetical protein BDN71DRAFT_1433384 [Pleurotus eryngii]|uniref:Uncharacterized protein n=1 Tax=Pleurotus eryngii TaxID=5323 RepID=A0A9P5ZRI0_PLEER|nr:hypothetical protein BDN71DRAFT_1433384 [Pleurotus eryngii]
MFHLSPDVEYIVRVQGPMNICLSGIKLGKSDHSKAEDVVMPGVVVLTDQRGDSKKEAGLNTRPMRSTQHTETMTSSRDANVLAPTTEAKTPALQPTPMFGQPDNRAWGSTFETPYSETTIIPSLSTMLGVPIKLKYPDTLQTKVTPPALSSSQVPFAEQRAKPKKKKNTGAPNSPRRDEEGNAQEMLAATTHSGTVIQIGDRLGVHYILFCKDEDGNFVFASQETTPCASFVLCHSYHLQGLKTWKYRVRVSNKVNT